MNGEVYHCRDRDGQECDAVVHLKNGKYGLIEIKSDKMNVPSFLMVLTGTGDYAYRRLDGVYVVPIGCLKN